MPSHPAKPDHSVLIAHLRSQFALDWHGIHGAPHWARVRVNGFALAASTGAQARVVELFTFLHDGHDPEHGHRAAQLARQLAGRLFSLSADELELLQIACRGHSDGHLARDITVLTCWDADRLDLGRVGIRPLAERLCTAAARRPEMIEVAYRRSVGRQVSEGAAGGSATTRAERSYVQYAQAQSIMTTRQSFPIQV
jgi:uncharacterized protein